MFWESEETYDLKMAYKELHEQFMQYHNGSTPLETFWVIMPTAFTVILSNCYAVLDNRFFQLCPSIVEFYFLVVPLILHATLLSENITESLVAMVFIFPTLLLLVVIKSKNRYNFDWHQITSSFRIPVLITNFRGTVCLISAICILAVDFTSFPRRFAKTEKFGWGVMDTGVGLFVTANGLVDPVTKGIHHNLKKTLRSCIPLIILGLLRWASLSYLDYQQHVTEYGVHWNFFFTLLCTRITSAVLLQVVNEPLCLAVFCLMTHQTILGNAVAAWVMSEAPRDNFVSANREGLCSLLGYVALHQASISLGIWIQERQKRKEGEQLLIGVSVIAIVAWMLSIVIGPPSRRLADMSYVLWIIGYSCSMLAMLLVAQIISIVLSAISGKPPYSPSLLTAINFNGLGFFLLANLLTGTINMSIQTLMISPLGSVIIIFIYMLSLCVTVKYLYNKNIKLRCW